jgi:hypothetical protein
MMKTMDRSDVVDEMRRIIQRCERKVYLAKQCGRIDADEQLETMKGLADMSAIVARLDGKDVRIEDGRIVIYGPFDFKLA